MVLNIPEVAPCTLSWAPLATPSTFSAIPPEVFFSLLCFDDAVLFFDGAGLGDLDCEPSRTCNFRGALDF